MKKLSRRDAIVAAGNTDSVIALAADYSGLRSQVFANLGTADPPGRDRHDNVIETRYEAIIDVIATTQATTYEGAAFQLAIAISELSVGLEDRWTWAGQRQATGRALRLIDSALRVIERRAGVCLIALGLDNEERNLGYCLPPEITKEAPEALLDSAKARAKGGAS